ncbi:hypothetical protein PPERSA_12933 [Pseudocohnilembus persalinus]|uniref:Uncharacterized protein n=1 Tax=Pseudocohnilembus persalinus TaxID=266149 RepID=A0A0V0R1N8_PSEPJ|nr:hypothetical protein PPERSA_12933 [Pseudocohnilembus persalinus]|eukprot:KRX08452.1 hypothetical protein PPERSA_12933 [Pseudocohnilembus persalinus]
MEVELKYTQIQDNYLDQEIEKQQIYFEEFNFENSQIQNKQKQGKFLDNEQLIQQEFKQKIKKNNETFLGCEENTENLDNKNFQTNQQQIIEQKNNQIQEQNYKSLLTLNIQCMQNLIQSTFIEGTQLIDQNWIDSQINNIREQQQKFNQDIKKNNIKSQNPFNPRCLEFSMQFAQDVNKHLILKNVYPKLKFNQRKQKYIELKQTLKIQLSNENQQQNYGIFQKNDSIQKNNKPESQEYNQKYKNQESSIKMFKHILIQFVIQKYKQHFLSQNEKDDNNIFNNNNLTTKNINIFNTQQEEQEIRQKISQINLNFNEIDQQKENLCKNFAFSMEVFQFFVTIIKKLKFETQKYCLNVRDIGRKISHFIAIELLIQLFPSFFPNVSQNYYQSLTQYQIPNDIYKNRFIIKK